MAKKTKSSFSSRLNNAGSVFEEQTLIQDTSQTNAVAYQGINNKKTSADINKPSVSSRFLRGNEDINNSSTDELDLSAELQEAKEIKQNYDNSKKLINILKSNKTIDMLFLIGCIYLSLLIFGVAMTTYQYNDEGVIEAQQLSYSDIVIKKNFEDLLEQYVECRNLYEKVLKIDAKLAKGEVEPMTLAPKYEAIVSEAELLYTKVDALPIDKQYQQIQAMLLEWLKSNLATYSKNMSVAISQNSETSAKTALANREVTYSNFTLITENLITMGEDLKGVDLVDIKEWDTKNALK